MNRSSNFIGRELELEALNRFLNKPISSLIVIKGRRRIGKSRLVNEFAKRNRVRLLSFEGLAPEKGITAQHQRNEFAKQMGFASLITNDWTDLFRALYGEVKIGKTIILMDEISWMAFRDNTFLSKLKNAWDLLFKNNNKLLLILCGSASSWIEKNLLSSTGFVGRISFVLTLDELKLNEVRKFWNTNISSYEILKLLSVTGGVPKYLEEINPHLTAENNIKNLCFTRGELLYEEFDNIFSSSFIRKSNMYKRLVQLLAEGAKEAAELGKLVNVKSLGRLSEYLEELELAGFIKRDYTWSLNTGQDAKLSKYRLSDNYLRFYLKYIDRYKTKIKRGSFNIKSISSLPAWDTIMGLQFENMVLNNREVLFKILGISIDDIVSENPYFQRITTKQKGCQIDYMIQTRSHSLYICEIKFSKNIIAGNVIREVQQKIEALQNLKLFSYRPVLIHVNGVSKEIERSDYFVKIIDYGTLIEANRNLLTER